MKIQAEIVNGICPTCDEYTPLVGLTKQSRHKNRVNAKRFRAKLRVQNQIPAWRIRSICGRGRTFYDCGTRSGLLEDVESEIKGMRNNAVNIEFLKKRTEKLTEDVEKLIRNGSGHQ